MGCSANIIIHYSDATIVTIYNIKYTYVCYVILLRYLIRSFTFLVPLFREEREHLRSELSKVIL
jgi:hypothetical protein